MQTRMSEYEIKIQPLWEIISDHINKTCKWGYDCEIEHTHYVSECSFNFQFSDERNSHTEYNFNFCPKCGGKIEEMNNENNSIK